MLTYQIHYILSSTETVWLRKTSRSYSVPEENPRPLVKNPSIWFNTLKQIGFTLNGILNKGVKCPLPRDNVQFRRVFINGASCVFNLTCSIYTQFFHSFAWYLLGMWVFDIYRLLFTWCGMYLPEFVVYRFVIYFSTFFMWYRCSHNHVWKMYIPLHVIIPR